MHRYNEQTVAKVRTDYLHTLQRKYEAEVQRQQLIVGSEDYTAKDRTAAKKKIDRIAKQIEECREYDQVVAHLANDKIVIDLETLTIMIGWNGAGKTNAIEGIKILSEVSTGLDFSIILDGSKNRDSDIRGVSKGCCKFNTSYFKLGCIVDLDEEFDLVYSIKIKVGDRIYVDEESLCKVSTNDETELVFKTKKAASKDSVDIKVEYNNGMSEKNSISYFYDITI